MKQSLSFLSLSGLYALVFSLSLSFSESVEAKTYIYREKDGTIWYTNRHPSPKEAHKYELVGEIEDTTSKKPTHNPKKVGCIGFSAKELRRREGLFDQMIIQQAKHHAISPYLVKSVIAIESCFDQQAVSRAGAEGLMQLMPGTAKKMGVTDSFDPAQNIRGGVGYLRLMLDRFDNNERLALAAYNAGPGAVDKYDGIPPFPETQGYVKKVLARYQRYVLAARQTKEKKQYLSWN